MADFVSPSPDNTSLPRIQILRTSQHLCSSVKGKFSQAVGDFNTKVSWSLYKSLVMGTTISHFRSVTFASLPPLSINGKFFLSLPVTQIVIFKVAILKIYVA